MTQASRKGMTYLRRRSDSLTCRPVGGRCGLFGGGGFFHFPQLQFGLLLGAGAEQRGAGRVLAAAAEEPARRLRHHETAQHEQNARRQRHPEDAPPGGILEGKQLVGVAELLDMIDAAC